MSCEQNEDHNDYCKGCHTCADCLGESLADNWARIESLTSQLSELKAEHEALKQGQSTDKNMKLFLTSWPHGSLRLVEVIKEREDKKGYFYIRYTEGRRAGGTDTTSSEFLFDLPIPSEGE